MKSITVPAQSVPVRAECDVLVVGCGTAGCAAAISAAREGAQVYAIDWQPFPGGTLGNGGIGLNSYYSTYIDETVPVRQVARGFAEELLQRLNAEQGATGKIYVDAARNPYRRPCLTYMDHEIYKSVLTEMMQEAGVHLLLHTFLSGVIAEDGKVQCALVESKSGREAIKAHSFVDCSGDGDLAVAAGAQWRTMHDRYHTASNTGLPFGIGGIDMVKFCACARKRGWLVEDDCWDDNGKTRQGLLRLRVRFDKDPELRTLTETGFGGMFLISLHETDATYINMIGIDKVDVTDVEQLTRAEGDLRVRAREAVKAFQRCLPGFENCFMNWQAATLGVRGSRTILCDHSLTNEEIVSCTRFPDEVGVFGFHDYAPIGEKWVIRGNGAYALPYRMLLPRGLKNVWAAGRCVTEDFYAQMSTRSTVCCLEQGQAAGIAAALCAKNQVESRELPYAALRERLLAQNVYLGE